MHGLHSHAFSEVRLQREDRHGHPKGRCAAALDTVVLPEGVAHSGHAAVGAREEGNLRHPGRAAGQAGGQAPPCMRVCKSARGRPRMAVRTSRAHQRGITCDGGPAVSLAHLVVGPTTWVGRAARWVHAGPQAHPTCRDERGHVTGALADVGVQLGRPARAAICDQHHPPRAPKQRREVLPSDGLCRHRVESEPGDQGERHTLHIFILFI
eukprot:COSAG01_NODE_1313_length_10770_cov_14.047887_6_plen_210_part_00